MVAVSDGFMFIMPLFVLAAIMVEYCSAGTPKMQNLA